MKATWLPEDFVNYTVTPVGGDKLAVNNASFVQDIKNTDSSNVFESLNHSFIYNNIYYLNVLKDFSPLSGFEFL